MAKTCLKEEKPTSETVWKAHDQAAGVFQTLSLKGTNDRAAESVMHSCANVNVVHGGWDLGAVSLRVSLHNVGLSSLSVFMYTGNNTFLSTLSSSLVKWDQYLCSYKDERI